MDQSSKDGLEALLVIHFYLSDNVLILFRFCYQVAEAVKYLHSLNITHRDLKLENMLIDRFKNIKLCDFGFVKQCADSDLSKTFCGSKSYAAPEILKVRVSWFT